MLFAPVAQSPVLLPHIPAVSGVRIVLVAVVFPVLLPRFPTVSGADVLGVPTTLVRLATYYFYALFFAPFPVLSIAQAELVHHVVLVVPRPCECQHRRSDVLRWSESDRRSENPIFKLADREYILTNIVIKQRVFIVVAPVDFVGQDPKGGMNLILVSCYRLGKKIKGRILPSGIAQRPQGHLLSTHSGNIALPGGYMHS